MVVILLKSTQILILLITLKMPQNCALPLQEQPQRGDRIKPRIRGTNHLSHNVKPEYSMEYLLGSFFLALSRDSASVKPSIQLQDLHSTALGPTLDKVPMSSVSTVTCQSILPGTVPTRSSYNVDNPHSNIYGNRK
jgi:hypothetical protein